MSTESYMLQCNANKLSKAEDSSSEEENFVVDYILNDDEEEDDEEEHVQLLNKDGSIRKVKRKNYDRRPKKKKCNENPWTISPWLKLLLDPETSDANSRQGKEFRRKFRMPLKGFQDLVIKCKETNHSLFCYGAVDACGVPSIPLELKLLTVLRILGGGLSCSDGADLTGGIISESECHKFFIGFIHNFSMLFEKEFIKPLVGEEQDLSMGMYSKMGLPGCVGSIDATFVPCDMLPAEYCNLLKGDKGRGLLFNVVVDHSKRVLDVQCPVFASINDKIAVKSNLFIRDLKNKSIYVDVVYKIRTGENENDYIESSACYVIADGGYIRVPQILSGFPSGSLDRTAYKFNDWLESVRKDVECFFGILKKRFRILKNATNLHSVKSVHYLFVACCILHNMILSIDEENIDWDAENNWKSIVSLSDPVTHDEEMQNASSEINFSEIIDDENEGCEIDFATLVEQTELDENAAIKFEELRGRISKHLQFVFTSKELKWPRTRSEINKNSEYNNI